MGRRDAEARRVAPQDARDARERLRVADDALGEELLEAQHALAVGLEQALDGHVRRLADDLGDLLAPELAFARARRARAPARSRTLTALSGSARPGR